MEAQNKKDGFCFTYSAKEQSEIQKIRRKYEIKEENNSSESYYNNNDNDNDDEVIGL